MNQYFLGKLKILSILYFEASDKVIYGITDRFQKLGSLVKKAAKTYLLSYVIKMVMTSISID